MFHQNNIPSGFESIRQGSTHAVVRNDVADPGRAFLMQPWPRDLMRSPGVPVGRIPLEILETGNHQYLKRWYVHGGLLGPLLGAFFLGSSRPLRELEAAVYAVASGVPTVEPLGICSWRLHGPIHRSAIMTRRQYGATNVAEYLSRARHVHPARRHQLIISAAEAVRRMHDIGLFHADLNLTNLLVCDSSGGPSDQLSVLIIDWDGARVRRRVGTFGRIRNLLRLSRSADKLSRSGIPITFTDKLRFLRVYCNGQVPLVRWLTLRGPIKMIYSVKWRLSDALYKGLGRVHALRQP